MPDALLNDDFRDMLDALLDHGVEFLVVGAFAVALHGTPRATGDLDLWVRPTPENAARVMRALSAFGAPAKALGFDERDVAREGLVFQLGVPPRRIDLTTAIDGVRFDEAWSRRVTVDLAGRRVPFLGRSDLVTNKRAAGRPKDRADLAMLGEE